MKPEEAIVILMNSNEYHHAKGDLPHSALSVEAFNMAIEALKERPYGEWRVHSHCSDGFSYKCSLCGRVVNSDYWFEQKEILSVYPYCHCGAKMVAVENPFKWYFGLGKSDDITDVKHIKVGDTIYTQDDDKQGWTGREENK